MSSKIAFILIAVILCCTAENDLEFSPSIIEIDPPSGSEDFHIGYPITITFDRNIKCGETCVMYFLGDNRVITVPMDNSMINNNVLVVVPGLRENIMYVASIPKNAVIGVDNKPFDGLSNYEITTSDFSNPTLIDVNPKDNSNINAEGSIYMYFSEDIMITGNWTAWVRCNEATVTPIRPEDVRLIKDTIVYDYVLPSSASCNVVIDEVSICDMNGNTLMNPVNLHYYVKDVNPPVVTMQLAPITDPENASRITDYYLTVTDENPVTINTAMDGGVTVVTTEVIYLYPASECEIQNNVVLLPSKGQLPLDSNAQLIVPAGFFLDSYNNGNAATSFAFHVTANTAKPVPLLIETPIMNTEDMITIRFDSAIGYNYGTIDGVYMKCVNCSNHITIPITAIAWHDTKLHAYFSGAENKQYYIVSLFANAAYNVYGNGNDAYEFPTQVFIRSNEAPEVVLEKCTPAPNAKTIPLSTFATIAFNQKVKRETCSLVATTVVGDTVYSTPLIPSTVDQYRMEHSYTMSGLRAFSEYTIEVPANCFSNEYSFPNTKAYMHFTTTRDHAPNVLSFNLEGQQDVLLDEYMVFNFDQEIVLANDASVLVKRKGDITGVYHRVGAVSSTSFTVYNHISEYRLDSNTEYIVYIPNGVVCNPDNMCMTEYTFNSFRTATESINAVILQSTIPSSGATNVDKDSTLTLHFTNTVRVARGPEPVYTILEESIVVTGTAVYNGQDVLLTFPFKSGKTYTYVYDTSLFSTNKGSVVHYDIGSSFSFTIRDTDGPICYRHTVQDMQNVEFLYDEHVAVGTGSLYIYSSENVLMGGPYSASSTTNPIKMVSYINAQGLPDDIYTFKVNEGFVKDLNDNNSPAFEFTYIYDRFPPYITNVTQPSIVFEPVHFLFNEEVHTQECTFVVIDSNEKRYVVNSAMFVKETDTDYKLLPFDGAWIESYTYTATIPAVCFADKRGIQMTNSKTVSFTAPHVEPLSVINESCTPVANSIVYRYTLEENTVTITVNQNIRYVEGKLISLQNANHCILIGSSMSNPEIFTINENKFIFNMATMDKECLSDTLYLIADEGAVIGVLTGAVSPMSTVLNPAYKFELKTEAPAIVDVSAIYANSLVIVKDAKIVVTFASAIIGPTDENNLLTQSQIDSFVRFYNSSNTRISLAQVFHGRIHANLLEIIVDEPFSPLLNTQIRSISFIPVPISEGIHGENTDAVTGSYPLTLVFALPPLFTTLGVKGGTTSTGVQPVIEITFSQKVVPFATECTAIVVAESGKITRVSVAEIETKSEYDFTWSPADTAIFQPFTSYTLTVDYGCFLFEETLSPAHGISNTLAFTTGTDTEGPVFLGLDVRQVQVTPNREIHLKSDDKLFLVFNKDVETVEGGFVYFMNEADGSIVQIPSAELQNSLYSYAVEVMWFNSGVASQSVYTVRVDSIVVDMYGNKMKVMSPVVYRIYTPVSHPISVKNQKASVLSTGIVMLSFDAAIDMNLDVDVSDKSYCQYMIIKYPSAIVTTFYDVCVGGAYSGATIRLAYKSEYVDMENGQKYYVYVKNSIVDDWSYPSSIQVDDSSIVTDAPSRVELLRIQTGLTENTRLYSFVIDRGNTHGQVITNLVIHTECGVSIQNLMVPYSTTTFYEVNILVPEDKPLSIYVKAISENGSSAYSKVLIVEHPRVISTVPPPIDVTMVTATQLNEKDICLDWNIPQIPETITAYTINGSVVTTNTITLTNLENGEHTVSMIAHSYSGPSEAVTFTFVCDHSLSAHVTHTETGDKFAHVTVHVSYDDSRVECILNAGNVIRAVDDVEYNEANILFTGLMPTFSYSGLCWAYSLHSNVVSPSFTVSFTTIADTPEPNFRVESVDFSSARIGYATIAIDVPAVVSCVLSPLNYNYVHGDIMSDGIHATFMLDGDKTLVFTSYPDSDEMRMYCTAEDLIGKHIMSVYTSQIYTRPVIESTLPAPIPSLENNEAGVSTRPIIVFTYLDTVAYSEISSSFIIEDINSHEQREYDVGASFMFLGNSIAISVEEPLAICTTYTYYFTDGSAIEDVKTKDTPNRIGYDEYEFTTTCNPDGPTASMDSIVAPSESLAITFSSAVTLNEGSIELKHEDHSHFYSSNSPEVTSNDNVLLISTYGLNALASYTLTIPKCYVYDTNGNCNEEMSFELLTTVDTERPFVLLTTPSDGQEYIPNDIPLTISFNKDVRLNALSKIIVTTNTQPVVLSPLDIVIDGRVVSILLHRGFSLGNDELSEIEVTVTLEADAFRDYYGNASVEEMFSFLAVSDRCGSSYLSNQMERICKCSNEDNKCVCDCGSVNLFEL